MILAIDIGSSSIRAGVFDDDGRAVEGLSAARAHALRLSRDGGSETDADGLFTLLAGCIDEVTGRLSETRSSARPGIEGVAVSAFLHSLLAVDHDGRPASALTTWADTRSAAESERLSSELDEEQVRSRTGCVFNPSYYPARLLWYREKHSEVFRAADWWCSFGEYALQRLFGKRLCSVSMASATGMFDHAQCAWDRILLEHLRVEESKLSPLGDMDTPLVGLRPEFARRWPTLAPVPWFPAVADGACSNVGSGCAGPGSIAVMVGTSGAMRAVVPEGKLPSLPRGLWRYRVDRQRLLIGGVLGNGGNVFEWMKSTLSLAGTPEEIDAALLEREPACHGLAMLPFFTGERSVGWKPRARAALVGMSLDTSALDVLQAGMEAVAYRFAVIQGLLDTVVGSARLTVATGGALLRSRAWTQIIADVLGRPVTLSAVPEASSRGAALLGLEALGKILDVREAPALLGEALHPRAERRAAHQEAAARQEKLARAVEGL